MDRNNYPDIKVNYPGLCSSKWHEIAKKQLTNGYGAILTIRVGSKEKAFKFIDSLTIPYTLSNIGDTKHLSFIRVPQSVFTAQISRRRMQEYLRIL